MIFLVTQIVSTNLYFIYFTCCHRYSKNDKLEKPFCKDIIGILSYYLVKRLRRIPYLIKHLYYFSHLPVGISSILMLKNLNY